MTEAGPAGIRPSHFFALTTGALALGAIVLLRHESPAEMALAVLTIGAAGAGAFAVYRTLQPLTSGDTRGPSLVGGRTRAALERDKALTLRSLKELEFDHAMGKVSEADFSEMRSRLRARALRLMQQLDGTAVYRDRIESDLASLVEAAPPDRRGEPGGLEAERSVQAKPCRDCGTANETDARFCKMCGHALAG